MNCPKCGRACTKHKQSTVKRFVSREQYASDFCGACQRWWPSCVPVGAYDAPNGMTVMAAMTTDRRALAGQIDAERIRSRAESGQRNMSDLLSRMYGWPIETRRTPGKDGDSLYLRRCAAHEVFVGESTGLAELKCQCGERIVLSDGGLAKCKCGTLFQRRGFTVTEVG